MDWFGRFANMAAEESGEEGAMPGEMGINSEDLKTGAAPTPTLMPGAAPCKTEGIKSEERGEKGDLMEIYRRDPSREKIRRRQLSNLSGALPFSFGAKAKLFLLKLTLPKLLGFSLLLLLFFSKFARFFSRNDGRIFSSQFRLQCINSSHRVMCFLQEGKKISSRVRFHDWRRHANLAELHAHQTMLRVIVFRVLVDSLDNKSGKPHQEDVLLLQLAAHACVLSLRNERLVVSANGREKGS